MIFTKSTIEKRLASDKNILNQIKERESLPEIIIKDGKNHLGRGNSKNLTEEEKIAIGVLANLEGKDLAAEVMGVSSSTAGHLKIAQKTHSQNGRNQRAGLDSSLKEKIEERLNSTKLTAQEMAAERLLRSLGCLTDDKLENADAKTVSQITNQMSQVIRNLSGQKNESKGNTGVRITLVQPKGSNEDSFETIEIGLGA